jgi:L-asparaginase II
MRVIRGDRVESVHRGHAVICGPDGAVVEAWGDPAAVVYPRSACKMMQALPLLETGAGRDLTDRHLALACASHEGAPVHVGLARAWLSNMGMGDDDLRCGAHIPYSDAAARDLVRAGEAPCQVHNNCSGKHCGFLMVGRQVGGGPDYVDPDHPVQGLVRTAFEEVTGMESPGFGIDGCSAPNFATRLDAFAAGLARFARPGGGARGEAVARLTAAMAAHPELVAGEGRACTDLMRAMGGRAAVKTGAEAVFAAILPERGLGIAVKISDGGTRAAEGVIAALLVRVGALDAEAPVARRLTEGPILNRRGLVTGRHEVVLA